MMRAQGRGLRCSRPRRGQAALVVPALAALLFLAPPPPVAAEVADLNLAALVPEAAAGWSREGPDELYDDRTIFKYMDGAGEVYLSFDYRGMLVRRFGRTEGPTITVELYDMGRSADAFGIFSRNRQGDEAGVGQDSEYRSGYLTFWRDRYFAMIYAEEETDASREAVFTLGRGIAQRIGRDGERPALLAILPPDGLDPRSVWYFHAYTDLNEHYFVADDNVLGLGPGTNAVLARYEGDEWPAFLLAVRYPSPEDADAARAGLAAAFTPEAEDGGPVEIEDGTWTMSAASGRYVLAVFDGADAAAAERLLAGARRRIEEEPR